MTSRTFPGGILPRGKGAEARQPANRKSRTAVCMKRVFMKIDLLLYSFRKGKVLRIICTMLLALAAPLGAEPKILVVTAGSADYIRAAGGTLAAFIQQGYTV